MAIFVSGSSRAAARSVHSVHSVRCLAVLLIGLLATATAAAQPAPAADVAAAPASPMPSDPAAMPAAPAAGATTEGGTPLALKHSCMAAINSDQQWTDELRAAVQKHMTYDAHNAEATLIATNQRHVIMAYAALWLAAVGFLVLQWRKQQALREQLEALRRDLDAAVKGSSP